VKVLVAGATGAIGRRLLPKLIGEGHEVVGMTRRPESARLLTDIGARPVVVDVYDANRIHRIIDDVTPDAVIHQLTDLGSRDYAANARLRMEGTPNLVSAAKEAGVRRMVAQSIAWIYRPGHKPAVEQDRLDARTSAYQGIVALEESVATMPVHVVLRYGTLYGPGTWYAPDGAISNDARRGEFQPGTAWTSFVEVDDAAAAAVQALSWPSGVYNIVDDEPAKPHDWLPIFCEGLGIEYSSLPADAEASGRPVSNAAARAMGWAPATSSWRTGLPRTMAAR
jgi:nucleoside-diphosphate-sugar epimerase